MVGVRILLLHLVTFCVGWQVVGLRSSVKDRDWLLCVHTHSEGTVSQIFYLGPSFYIMAKIRKHLIHFVIIIF